MNQTWEKITGLNLKSVRKRFSDKKSWWWHLGHNPAQIEAEYRQFLYLLAMHPESSLVPWSADLDEFWRLHMLNTPAYTADCDAFAGRPLHHTPRPAAGTSAHSLAFAQTRKLYIESFGKPSKKRGRTSGDTGQYISHTPDAFNDAGAGTIHTHHAGHHAVHHSTGFFGSASHGGGHSCGGHSSCGGHGGH